MHWDDPEGWDREGGGREDQDGDHVYTHGLTGLWMSILPVSEASSESVRIIS